MVEDDTTADRTAKDRKYDKYLAQEFQSQVEKGKEIKNSPTSKGDGVTESDPSFEKVIILQPTK